MLGPMDGELWGGVLVFRHVMYTNLGNGIFNTVFAQESTCRCTVVNLDMVKVTFPIPYSLSRVRGLHETSHTTVQELLQPSKPFRLQLRKHPHPEIQEIYIQSPILQHQYNCQTSGIYSSMLLQTS